MEENVLDFLVVAEDSSPPLSILVVPSDCNKIKMLKQHCFPDGMCPFSFLDAGSVAGAYVLNIC